MNKFSELIAKLSEILQIDQELNFGIICALELRRLEGKSMKRMFEEA